MELGTTLLTKTEFLLLQRHVGLTLESLMIIKQQAECFQI